MRGSPLLRAFIAFVIIAATGLPIWKLTHRVMAAPTSLAVPAPVEQKEVQMEFTLTQPAPQISVQHLGKKIWSGEAPESRVEATFSIPWPAEGVDLRVQIDWPEGTKTAAARVQLSTPEGQEYERSIWANGPADKVLTFR